MDSPFSVGQWLWLIPGEPTEACRGLEQGRLEILHCPKIGVMESRSYHCIFKVEAMIILSVHIPSICSCFDQGFCSEGRPSAPGMGLVLFGSDRCCPALFWMCCDLWCGILVRMCFPIALSTIQQRSHLHGFLLEGLVCLVRPNNCRRTLRRRRQKRTR